MIKKITQALLSLTAKLTSYSNVAEYNLLVRMRDN
jgi:hypothetical protein